MSNVFDLFIWLIDYDELGPAVVTPDLDTPVSEVSSGVDGHYSQPKERMYAVCKDVRPKTIQTLDSKDKVERVPSHYSHVSIIATKCNIYNLSLIS